MIYLDNAATTFKKPRSVLREVNACLKRYCANAGRGSYRLSLKTAEKIYEARERVASLLGSDMAENVMFFYNATHALNFAIKVSVEDGDHVLISDVEHNATLRPIHAMAARGALTYSIFNSKGDIRENIKCALRPSTTTIVSTLQSNVFGREIDPLILIKAANDLKLTLILDASQYVGHKRLDISMADNALLCAPGHKGLFGIQGCGFCFITSKKIRRTFIEGGSGNESKNPFMPLGAPERYEAGTLGAPSIISLLKGIEFIEERSVEEIYSRISSLSERTVDCLTSLKGVKVYDVGGGIISFNYKDVPSETVSYELSRNGICTRAGFHCAPLAHRTLGTFDTGTVRVSLSYFNKTSDITGLYKELRYISRIY